MVRVWDLDGGQAPQVLEGHTDRVLGVAVTADGRRAVSAAEDRTVRVWNAEDGKEIATFTGESNMLGCAIALCRPLFMRVGASVVLTRSGVPSVQEMSDARAVHR